MLPSVVPSRSCTRGRMRAPRQQQRSLQSVRDIVTRVSPRSQATQLADTIAPWYWKFWAWLVNLMKVTGLERSCRVIYSQQCLLIPANLIRSWPLGTNCSWSTRVRQVMRITPFDLLTHELLLIFVRNFTNENRILSLCLMATHRDHFSHKLLY